MFSGISAAIPWATPCPWIWWIPALHGRRRHHRPGHPPGEPDTVNFAFIGDSTFFASGITGSTLYIIRTDIVLIVLEQSTNAMTGHQPHPGTGRTMMGEVSKISCQIRRTYGVTSVVTAILSSDLPLQWVRYKTPSRSKAFSAVIFVAPASPSQSPSCLHCDTAKMHRLQKNASGTGMSRSVIWQEKMRPLSHPCYGCSICAQVCPFGAITPDRGNRNECQHHALRVGGQGTILALSSSPRPPWKRGALPATPRPSNGSAGRLCVSHVRIGEEIHSPMIPQISADLIRFEPAEAVR